MGVGAGGGGIDVVMLVVILPLFWLLVKLGVLVLWWRAVSLPLFDSVGGISSIGDSRAGVAIDCCRYFGVRGSDDAGGEMYDGSTPTIGNV